MENYTSEYLDFKRHVFGLPPPYYNNNATITSVSSSDDDSGIYWIPIVTIGCIGLIITGCTIKNWWDMRTVKKELAARNNSLPIKNLLINETPQPCYNSTGNKTTV